MKLRLRKPWFVAVMAAIASRPTVQAATLSANVTEYTDSTLEVAGTLKLTPYRIAEGYNGVTYKWAPIETTVTMTGSGTITNLDPISKYDAPNISIQPYYFFNPDTYESIDHSNLDHTITVSNITFDDSVLAISAKGNHTVNAHFTNMGQLILSSCTANLSNARFSDNAALSLGGTTITPPSGGLTVSNDLLLTNNAILTTEPSSPSGRSHIQGNLTLAGGGLWPGLSGKPVDLILSEYRKAWGGVTFHWFGKVDLSQPNYSYYQYYDFPTINVNGTLSITNETGIGFSFTDSLREMYKDQNITDLPSESEPIFICNTLVGSTALLKPYQLVLDDELPDYATHTFLSNYEFEALPGTDGKTYIYLVSGVSTPPTSTGGDGSSDDDDIGGSDPIDPPSGGEDPDPEIPPSSLTYETLTKEQQNYSKPILKVNGDTPLYATGAYDYEWNNPDGTTLTIEGSGTVSTLEDNNSEAWMTVHLTNSQTASIGGDITFDYVCLDLYGGTYDIDSTFTNGAAVYLTDAAANINDATFTNASQLSLSNSTLNCDTLTVSNELHLQAYTKASTINGDLVLNGGVVHFDWYESDSGAFPTLTVTGSITIQAATQICFSSVPTPENYLFIANSVNEEKLNLLAAYTEDMYANTTALEGYEFGTSVSDKDGKVRIYLVEMDSPGDEGGGSNPIDPPSGGEGEGGEGGSDPITPPSDGEGEGGEGGSDPITPPSGGEGEGGEGGSDPIDPPSGGEGEGGEITDPSTPSKPSVPIFDPFIITGETIEITDGTPAIVLQGGTADATQAPDSKLNLDDITGSDGDLITTPQQKFSMVGRHKLGFSIVGADGTAGADLEIGSDEGDRSHIFLEGDEYRSRRTNVRNANVTIGDKTTLGAGKGSKLNLLGKGSNATNFGKVAADVYMGSGSTFLNQGTVEGMIDLANNSLMTNNGEIDGDVIIRRAAKVYGSGSYTGDTVVKTAGMLYIGNSPGFQRHNNVTLENKSTLGFYIDGTTPAGPNNTGAGTHSFMIVSGALTIDGIVNVELGIGRGILNAGNKPFMLTLMQVDNPEAISSSDKTEFVASITEGAELLKDGSAELTWEEELGRLIFTGQVDEGALIVRNGAAYANTLWASTSTVKDFVDTASSQQIIGTPGQTTAWGAAIGTFMDMKGSSGFNYNGGGFAVGVQHACTEEFRAGISLGRSFGQFEGEANTLTTDQSGIMAAITAQYVSVIEKGQSSMILSTYAAYGNIENDIKGVTGKNGDWRDEVFSAGLRADWLSKVGESSTLTFFVGLDYIYGTQEDICMNGSATAFTDGSMQRWSVPVGFTLRTETAMGACGLFAPELTVAYVGDISANAPRVKSAEGSIHGANPGRSAFMLNVGANWLFNENWSVGLFYNLEVRKDMTNQSGNFSLRYSF